jgi:hypothetical protein
MQAFSYQPQSESAAIAPVGTPTVAVTGEYADVAKSVPFTMEKMQVKDRESPDRQFRAVSEAMAFTDPTAPCALYTKEFRHRILFKALCGPIFPTLGENAIHGEQPRFPLVGLDW